MKFDIDSSLSYESNILKNNTDLFIFLYQIKIKCRLINGSATTFNDFALLLFEESKSILEYQIFSAKKS